EQNVFVVRLRAWIDAGAARVAMEAMSAARIRMWEVYAPRSASEADVHFAGDPLPFVGGAQHRHEIFEGAGVLRGELEPGQEVECLAELAAVIKAARDRWQVLHARGDVRRTILEDRSALVLAELPPRIGLADRDECGACR